MLLFGPECVVMSNPFGNYTWYPNHKMVAYRSRKQQDTVQIVRLPRGKNTHIDALTFSVNHMVETVL